MNLLALARVIGPSGISRGSALHSLAMPPSEVDGGAGFGFLPPRVGFVAGKEDVLVRQFLPSLSIFRTGCFPLLVS